MALPAAAPAAAAAGRALAPLAARAGQALRTAAPSIKTKAMDYISGATQGRVSSIDQAAQLVAQGKNGLAIVAEGLVRGGVPVGDVFTNRILQSMQDADMMALYQRLSSEFGKIYGAIDAASKFKSSKSDEERARDRLAREVVLWAKAKFRLSSAAEVKQFHAKLRLLLEMDESLLDDSDETIVQVESANRRYIA